MDLRHAADSGLGDFLFQLPNGPLTREERVRQLEEAVTQGRIKEDDLDRVMTRLLEELQRTS